MRFPLAFLLVLFTWLCVSIGGFYATKRVTNWSWITVRCLWCELGIVLFLFAQLVGTAYIRSERKARAAAAAAPPKLLSSFAQNTCRFMEVAECVFICDAESSELCMIGDKTLKQLADEGRARRHPNGSIVFEFPTDFTPITRPTIPPRR